MTTRDQGVALGILRGALFIMFGLVAPWHWLNMLQFSKFVTHVPLSIPKHLWDLFAFAWLALHAYCVGFVIWGQWRTVFVRKPSMRGPLTRVILGGIVIGISYVLLIKAIVSSW